jgi:hypothetical protein
VRSATIAGGMQSAPHPGQLIRGCSRCERMQVLPATQLAAARPLPGLQHDEHNSNMRAAAAFLRAVCAADGEALRVLGTYTDTASLLTHLSALAIDALNQPAATKSHSPNRRICISRIPRGANLRVRGIFASGA